MQRQKRSGSPVVERRIANPEVAGSIPARSCVMFLLHYSFFKGRWLMTMWDRRFFFIINK